MKLRRAKIIVVSNVLLVSGALIAACSGDDSTGTTPADAAVDVTVKDTGAPDAVADVVTMKDAGSDGGKTVTCGANTCAGTALGGFNIDGCCAAGNTCGYVIPPTQGGMCIQRNQPGTLDSSCPSRAVGPTTYKGCCKPTGVCGLQDDPQFGPGLGCFAYSDFGFPPPDGGGSCGGGDAGDGGGGGDAGDASTDGGSDSGPTDGSPG